MVNTFNTVGGWVHELKLEITFSKNHSIEIYEQSVSFSLKMFIANLSFWFYYFYSNKNWFRQNGIDIMTLKVFVVEPRLVGSLSINVCWNFMAYIRLIINLLTFHHRIIQLKIKTNWIFPSHSILWFWIELLCLVWFI